MAAARQRHTQQTTDDTDNRDTQSSLHTFSTLEKTRLREHTANIYYKISHSSYRQNIKINPERIPRWKSWRLRPSSSHILRIRGMARCIQLKPCSPEGFHCSYRRQSQLGSVVAGCYICVLIVDVATRFPLLLIFMCLALSLPCTFTGMLTAPKCYRCSTSLLASRSSCSRSILYSYLISLDTCSSYPSSAFELCSLLAMYL